jgi:uncharacterized membrane protein
MQYQIQIDIDLPRERVIALFDDPDNLRKWQEDLISFEHIEGMKGEVGAKSRLVYRMGKKTVPMVETITDKQLPDHYALSLCAGKVSNHVLNRFQPLDEKRTRIIHRCDFHCSGVMAFIARMVPGAFRRRSEKMLTAFKAFAETHA